MANNTFALSRRGFGFGLAAAFVSTAAPARAFTVEDARALVDQTVAEVNKIIASGASEEAMLVEFEKMFARYADVPAIARSALGPPGRSASGRR